MTGRRFTLTYEVEVSLLTGGGSASINLVAANGETISATGSGQGTPTDDPNVASIVETYVITGGTGRFSGATGNFIVQRTVSTVTGITSGSFEGNHRDSVVKAECVPTLRGQPKLASRFYGPGLCACDLPTTRSKSVSWSVLYVFRANEYGHALLSPAKTDFL